MHISSKDPELIRNMRKENIKAITKELDKIKGLTFDRRMIIDAMMVEYLNAINAKNSTSILSRISALLEKYKHQDFLKERIKEQRWNRNAKELNKKDANADIHKSLEIKEVSDDDNISKLEKQERFKTKSHDIRDADEASNDINDVDNDFSFDKFFESDDHEYNPLKHNRNEIAKKEKKAEKAKKGEKNANN